jgi:hypothetical protein
MAVTVVRTTSATQIGPLLTQASASTTYAPIVPTTQTGFRNIIINGDFRINQRAFTSVTTSNTYGFDRWKIFNAGGTVTYTPQPFTLGSPAQAGYESSNFARLVSSGQSASSDYAVLQQPIEDVRTFAGATVTVSFWAKASSGTPKVAVELSQIFASSADVNNLLGQVTLSTSWTRYSLTTTLPSISGKTIAANNALNVNLWTSGGTNYNSRINSLGIQNNTFDFWGVQVERGNIATPFEQRFIGTETSLCQRYYYASGIQYGPATGFGLGNSYHGPVLFPTTMRVSPAVVTFNNSNGASNSVSWYPGNTPGTPSLESITTQSFVINQSGSSYNGALYRYTASAEL